MDGLDSAWRPDLCGILLRLESDGALVLQPLQSNESLLSEMSMKLIGACVEGGIAVYLSIPGKPGHTNVKLHLNAAMASAVSKRDLTLARQDIRNALHFGATCGSDPL
jgi:hypothetical protein